MVTLTHCGLSWWHTLPVGAEWEHSNTPPLQWIPAALPWSGSSSSPMNTCSTPMVWSEPAASNMAILSCLTSVVEHSQMTAMQPSSTLERWRWLPETPNMLTSLVRSFIVWLPQSFLSFSVKETFPDDSFEGVAVAGNSCLNWLTVVLAMNCWRCCSYSSTSCLVVSLHERDT